MAAEDEELLRIIGASDKRTRLTAERLRALLDYNPATGEFVWRVSRGPAYKGSLAGSPHPNGYVYIKLDGKSYPVHRLVWLCMSGTFPPEDIDHINGHRNDNRLSNLRLATRAENCMNSKVRNTNTSGVKGVSWNQETRRWTAYINVNKSRLHLGRFIRIEDAAAAYEEAAKKYFGEFARPDRDRREQPKVDLADLGFV